MARPRLCQREAQANPSLPAIRAASNSKGGIGENSAAWDLHFGPKKASSPCTIDLVEDSI